MAKKKNNKMLLILGAAIGLFMYKKKKDAENEEFVLPPKSAVNLTAVRAFTPKNTLKKQATKRGLSMERIGNFENIQ